MPTLWQNSTENLEHFGRQCVSVRRLYDGRRETRRGTPEAARTTRQRCLRGDGALTGTAPGCFDMDRWSPSCCGGRSRRIRRRTCGVARADLVAGDGRRVLLWAGRITAGDWLGRAEECSIRHRCTRTSCGGEGCCRPGCLRFAPFSGAGGALLRAGGSRRKGCCSVTLRAGGGSAVGAVRTGGVLRWLGAESDSDLFLVSLLLLCGAAGGHGSSAPWARHGFAVGAVLGVLMLSRENAAVPARLRRAWMLTTSSPAALARASSPRRAARRHGAGDGPVHCATWRSAASFTSLPLSLASTSISAITEDGGA